MKKELILFVLAFSLVISGVYAQEYTGYAATSINVVNNSNDVVQNNLPEFNNSSYLQNPAFYAYVILIILAILIIIYVFFRPRPRKNNKTRVKRKIKKR